MTSIKILENTRLYHLLLYRQTQLHFLVHQSGLNFSFSMSRKSLFLFAAVVQSYLLVHYFIEVTNGNQIDSCSGTFKAWTRGGRTYR